MKEQRELQTAGAANRQTDRQTNKQTYDILITILHTPAGGGEVTRQGR